MNRNFWIIAVIAGLIITVIGLVTGKFFFLFLILPIGFGLFNTKHKNKDDEDETKYLE